MAVYSFVITVDLPTIIVERAFGLPASAAITHCQQHIAGKLRRFLDRLAHETFGLDLPLRDAFGVAGFSVRVAERPQVEVIHVWEPDGACQVQVLLDGRAKPFVCHGAATSHIGTNEEPHRD